jgi:outer membrane protein OmpA-like peptidoglycan-associated protein
MKKIFFTTVLLICSCLSLLAQESPTNKENEGFLIAGSRLGFSINNMTYSSPDLSIYEHHPYPSFQIGLTAGYEYLFKGLSIRSDLLLSSRGVRLTWGDINYRLTARYFDFRVPVTYTFFRNGKISPYVMLAPDISFVAGGNISYRSDYTNNSTRLSNANFTSTDMSFVFGGGVKFPIQIQTFKLILGAELGYNIGLSNTFSRKELNHSAHAINLPMYEVNGTRKNRNIEIAFTVSIPITFDKPTPAPIIQEPEEIIVEEKPTLEILEYEPKECYSVEEIKAFLTLGMPIEDKRVCIFDLKFEFGSAVLKKQSEKLLDELVSLFQASPEMTIQINGHTDNIGSDEYNQKLSENRAMSVYNYFLKKGIPSNHMTTKGFGSKYPIDTNDTDAGRAKNRRVEIDIMTSSSK